MIMDKALEFVDKNTDKPFFLYLTPTIPHADIIVPNNELFDYDGKFEEVPYPGKGYRPQEKPRATFAAMVTRLDRDVQRLVDLLKKKEVSYLLLIMGHIKKEDTIRSTLTVMGRSVE